ncbi:hypothetical protein [Halococcoides cellulosivorans]|uniref:Type IV secretion system protein TrbL n=1 Tax=Halococcoides cellulosivorans TaxID=1679096 RepID=A0A2R4X3Q8_9EURY|nr:hypothetical protein [Halococcoides cellulosivorans]AWB28434.1 hypothetical protein HARCEL1_12350 [Halococcoides cellulosivorans]
MVDLIDIVLEGFKEIIDWTTSQFTDGLQSGYESLTEGMFGTPTPETDGAFVFGAPQNPPWPSIQDALVGGDIMLISILILVMCVQARHTVRIFNIGSTYEDRRTQKTAWAGAFLIATWYWVAILVLYLINGFTLVMMPSLDSLNKLMLDLLKGIVTNQELSPGLSFIFALIGGLSMWALEALYYIREILIYIYVYGMPIAFAVAFGNVPVLSDIAVKFCKKFVPLIVLPLPAAVLFKGYDLLYSQNGMIPNDSLFLRYLVAISLPLIAVYLTWKTFKYATPLTAKVLGGATKIVAKGTAKGAKGALLIGGVAGGAYIGGAGVATTAARFGPKAAAGHAVAQKAAARRSKSEGNSGTPSYRRTENDPGR